MDAFNVATTGSGGFGEYLCFSWFADSEFAVVEDSTANGRHVVGRCVLSEGKPAVRAGGQLQSVDLASNGEPAASQAQDQPQLPAPRVDRQWENDPRAQPPHLQMQFGVLGACLLSNSETGCRKFHQNSPFGLQRISPPKKHHIS